MATEELLDWAAGQGLKWDMSPGEHGDQWAAGWRSISPTPARNLI